MFILVFLSVLVFGNFQSLYAEELVLMPIEKTNLIGCSSLFTAKDDSDFFGVDFKDKRNILASDLISKTEDLLDLVISIHLGIDFDSDRISKSGSQLILDLVERIYLQFYRKPLSRKNNATSSDWIEALRKYLDQIEVKIKEAISEEANNPESIRSKLTLIDKIERLDQKASSIDSDSTYVDDIYKDIEGILSLFSTGKQSLSKNPVHHKPFSLSDKEKKVLKKILPETSLKYLGSNLDIKSLYLDYINDYIAPSILDSIDKLSPREFIRFLAVEDNSLMTYTNRYRGKRLEHFLNLIDFDPRIKDYCLKNSFILRVYKSIISGRTEISYPVDMILSQIKRKDRSNFGVIYQKVLDNLDNLDNLNSKNYLSSFGSSDSKLLALFLATKIWNNLNPKMSIIEALKNNSVENISKIFSTLSSKDKISFSWIISVDPLIQKSSKVSVALAMISSFDVNSDEQALIWQLTHSSIREAIAETLVPTTRRLIGVFDYELLLKISDLIEIMSHQELISIKLKSYLKDSEDFEDLVSSKKTLGSILKRLGPSLR